jgi:hypothetical protein
MANLINLDSITTLEEVEELLATLWKKKGELKEDMVKTLSYQVWQEGPVVSSYLEGLVCKVEEGMYYSLSSVVTEEEYPIGYFLIVSFVKDGWVNWSVGPYDGRDGELVCSGIEDGKGVPVDMIVKAGFFPLTCYEKEVPLEVLNGTPQEVNEWVRDLELVQNKHGLVRVD